MVCPFFVLVCRWQPTAPAMDERDEAPHEAADKPEIKGTYR